MEPRTKWGLIRAAQAYAIFCLFFSIVAAIFIDRDPVQIGPIQISRQLLAAIVIYLHGFIIAWIELRRGIASQPEDPS